MELSTIYQRLRQKLGLAVPEKRPFVQLTECFEKRLPAWRAVPQAAPTGERVAVLIAPWQFTSVPYFSLECAFLLRSCGRDVTLLWAGENAFSSTLRERESTAIARVLELLREDFPIVDLATAPADGEIGATDLDRLIYENAVREWRGESAAQEFLAAHPEQREGVLWQARQMAHVLQKGAFDWVLIPGGVWAVSGLCVHLAEQLHLSYTTYDSGLGLLAVAHDAVAAHHGSFPAAFAEVWRRGEADPAERASISQRAAENLKIRMEGRDAYRLQPPQASAESRPACDILVALNYRLDSAALLRQKLFTSVTHWLSSILEWLRTQPGITLAIRQHPCERIPQFRSDDRWQDLLAEYSDLNGRVQFIAADDPINTYDLMSSARVVLPFTSRVGIEGSLLGKPVILCAHSFYETLPFVWSPNTADEYFRLIGEALSGKIQVSPSVQSAATTAYFLAEECLLMSTRFTPSADDFHVWANVPPAQFWGDAAMDDVRATFVDRRNLPLLCYQRKISSR